LDELFGPMVTEEFNTFFVGFKAKLFCQKSNIYVGTVTRSAVSTVTILMKTSLKPSADKNQKLWEYG
jgi:hypothetical protein